MKNFFKEAKEKYGFLDCGHSRLLEQFLNPNATKPKIEVPVEKICMDLRAWRDHGIVIEHVTGEEKIMRYTHEYFAIVSMNQFLMKGETKFFHDLAHAQLFNSRAEAGAFMRENKISGCVVRVTCEFTAHGV